MKNAGIANSVNKIALLILLSGSLVFHVKECFAAKEAKTPVVQRGFSTTEFTTAFLPSSFSYLISTNKNFTKP
jgi:hypothetical protein